MLCLATAWPLTGVKRSGLVLPDAADGPGSRYRVVVGFLRIAPFVQLAFIPAMNFPRRAALPRPTAHIFYHRRVKDVRDRLPKISGYWPSELYASRLVLAGIVGSRST